MNKPLTLRDIATTNHERALFWHRNTKRPWSPLEWAGAMCGEAGEAANVAKKMLRIELGTPGNELSERVTGDMDDLRAKLAGEIADTVLYACLLATFHGIDIQAAVIDKFNSKSEQLGAPQRLHSLPAFRERG